MTKTKLGNWLCNNGLHWYKRSTGRKICKRCKISFSLWGTPYGDEWRES